MIDDLAVALYTQQMIERLRSHGIRFRKKLVRNRDCAVLHVFEFQEPLLVQAGFREGCSMVGYEERACVSVGRFREQWYIPELDPFAGQGLGYYAQRLKVERKWEPSYWYTMRLRRAINIYNHGGKLPIGIQACVKKGIVPEGLMVVDGKPVRPEPTQCLTI